MIYWKVRDGDSANRFRVSLISETLDMRYDRGGDGPLVFAIGSRLELVAAGVLADYVQRGDLLPERGFQANYAWLGAEVGLQWHRSSVRLSIAGRRWWFDSNGATSEEFTLPSVEWVLEERLNYTYWNIRDDASVRDDYRNFVRVVGTAFGFTLEQDYRDTASPWGAEVGGGLDPTNAASQRSFSIHAWIRTGREFGNTVRLELRSDARVGVGQDDLNRTAIGGMAAPDTIPVAGMPWTTFRSANFVHAEPSLHVRVGTRHEVGAAVDGVFLVDPARTGEGATLRNTLGEWLLNETRPVPFTATGGAVGASLFADLRWPHAQLDLRVGWAPPFDFFEQTPVMGALVSLGFGG
jgi:hypothetical protein